VKCYDTKKEQRTRTKEGKIRDKEIKLRKKKIGREEKLRKKKNMRKLITIIGKEFFPPWRYTTHSGCVFYSPLLGFSFLAYEVA
jgi:hypothetical protein